MTNKHDEILHRLEQGEIDANEASRLIDANERVITMPARPHGLPDMDAYRRNWQPSFWGALAVVALAGRYVQVASRKRGFLSWFTLPLARLMLGLGALGAALTYIGRKAPWAHIRIEEKDGSQIEINVPVPVGGVSWLLNTVRPFVSGAEGEQIDLIVETLEALRDEMVGSHEPLTIDINDEGDRVQVYFG